MISVEVHLAESGRRGPGAAGHGAAPRSASRAGAHPERDGDGRERVVIRGWRPDATGWSILAVGSGSRCGCVHPAGVFAGVVDGPGIPDYRLEATYPDGVVVVLDDPYRYWPTLGELDLHLLAEGRHEGLWHHLGAQVRVHQGTTGHIVRGVGARRPGGPGRRRLQRLGRPDPPDESPWQFRGLGDLPARRRRRRALQVRGRDASRAR